MKLNVILSGMLPSPVAAAAPELRVALAGLPRRSWGVVERLRVEGPEAAWLDALGIGVGERVMVLRRAPLGGPFHVRTATGAEFAIEARCAERIDVVPVRADASAPT